VMEGDGGRWDGLGVDDGPWGKGLRPFS
jgi:hypothetical protein